MYLVLNILQPVAVVSKSCHQNTHECYYSLSIQPIDDSRRCPRGEKVNLIRTLWLQEKETRLAAEAKVRLLP